MSFYKKFLISNWFAKVLRVIEACCQHYNIELWLLRCWLWYRTRVSLERKFWRLCCWKGWKRLSTTLYSGAQIISDVCLREELFKYTQYVNVVLCRTLDISALPLEPHNRLFNFRSTLSLLAWQVNFVAANNNWNSCAAFSDDLLGDENKFVWLVEEKIGLNLKRVWGGVFAFLTVFWETLFFKINFRVEIFKKWLLKIIVELLGLITMIKI